MSGSRADIIAHPVRLRILIAIAGRELSTQQIAESLPDVPTTTLYRHVQKLAQAGVLEVARETPIRGTVEKIYALASGAGALSHSDLQSTTPQDRLQLFTSFLTSLSASLRAYLEADAEDPAASQPLSFAAPVYLSPAENQEFRREVMALIKRYQSPSEDPERRRTTISLILIPDRKNP
jgi:predicted ArsR family transcriptional regulator